MDSENALKKCPKFSTDYQCQAGRQNWLFWGLLGSARAVGQTPNVPMWVGIKLFFKSAVGKFFKTLRWLECRQMGLVCVELQRNCLPR